MLFKGRRQTGWPPPGARILQYTRAKLDQDLPSKMPFREDPSPAELPSTDVHPYQALSPETVLEAMESVGVVTDARILALNSYENRVYQVGVEDGLPLIAKFYRPQRWMREQILEEHAFALELAALEIPVVPPMLLAGGQSLHEYEGFSFALFERRAGRAPDLDNPDNLLVLGRFLGRVHAAGATHNFAHRPALTVQRFAIESRDYLLQHGFIPESLVRAYDTLSRDLIARVEAVFARTRGVARLRIHGDCHPGNVLWRDDAPHFVDFDDTMTGPAVQDLWMLMSGERDQRQGQLLEIVEGYNEFHDFDARELELIESLRTLRIMHYSAWLARRWEDPAFPRSFPWFNTERYWAEHILELREQMAALDEPPLQLF